MIRLSELLSAEALRRYDDDGEPVYTTGERVLITLRWFDWASSERVIEALGLDLADRFERARYLHSLLYFVERGRVETRNHLGTVEFRLLVTAKRMPVTKCRRCTQPPMPGFVLCAKHLEWQRENKNARDRGQGKVNHCGACGEAGHKSRSCARRAA